ncbi:MAG: hypothetical protein IMY72_06100 [Bacteroidetes bacterium]|nr:hypothetical protein [Bacteroidota bacterium]
MKQFAFLFVLLFSFGFVKAQQSEPSGNVKKDQIKIENIFIYQKNNDGKQNFFLPSTLFIYGLNKNLEVRISEQYEFYKIKTDNSTLKTDNFGNVKLGTKIQLVRNENTKVALLNHLVVPKNNFEIENFGLINILAVSHRLTKTINVGYSVGYTYFNQSSASYTLFFNKYFTKKMYAYVEAFGDYDFKKNYSNIANLGMVYSVNKHIDIDIEAGKGLNSDTDFYSFIICWYF